MRFSVNCSVHDQTPAFSFYHGGFNNYISNSKKGKHVIASRINPKKKVQKCNCNQKLINPENWDVISASSSSFFFLLLFFSSVSRMSFIFSFSLLSSHFYFSSFHLCLSSSLSLFKSLSHHMSLSLFIFISLFISLYTQKLFLINENILGTSPAKLALHMPLSLPTMSFATSSSAVLQEYRYSSFSPSLPLTHLLTPHPHTKQTHEANLTEQNWSNSVLVPTIATMC